MTADVNTALARTLVDEWARSGVTLAALAPGSRSTPLALALSADSRIRLEVFVDERSASFFALGGAKASGRPTVVLTTSGTAAVNVHPAVVEAHHARAPLIVATADRPPELRDTGAGQTIDQLKLFGSHARWFVDVGAPEGGTDADRAGSGRYWRSLGARAAAEALGPPAGPVHLNLAFREPLVPTGDEVPELPGRSSGEPWVATSARRAIPHADDVDRLAKAVAGCPRGLVVAGWGADVVDPGALEALAATAGWPVLADPVSGLRQGPHAVSAYDALLRVPAFAGRFRPELVVHLGAPLTGTAATAWLDASVPRVVVDPDRAWLDPRRTASERVVADPGLLVAGLLDRLAGRAPATGGSPWLAAWLGAEARARRALDDLLDSWEEPFEGRVARDLAACLPSGATLVVGSSMPVRDLEGFARPRPGLRVVANRGANGIDGFVSTVLGVAAASPVGGSVAALAGDLTFLHDTGGLLAAGRRGVDAVFVVADNDGGGIFSFLAQAGIGPPFEELFGTPHGIDLVELAAVHGLAARRIGRAAELVPAVEAATAAGGVQLVVVPTDRVENVTRHRAAWDAVAAAVAHL